MKKFKINYLNSNEGNYLYGGDNFSYQPCPNCVPNLRNKILNMKDKKKFSFFDIKDFIKHNFPKGLYSDIIKNENNKYNFNIEHVIPFSLFSRIGRNNIDSNSILQNNLEPYNDAHIMFTSLKSINSYRNNFKLSDKTTLHINNLKSYYSNIYLIKTNNNQIKILYTKNYKSYINIKNKKYSNLHKNNFPNLHNDSNIIILTKIEKNYTTFTLRDFTKLKVLNDNIIEINNWIKQPLYDFDSFSCEKNKCIFKPKLSSKGDISRSLNYFQLTYGYNPHNRNTNAESYFNVQNKIDYKNNNQWLGNYDDNMNFIHFDDLKWKYQYYDQLKMLYNWIINDPITEQEHERNKLIALKTGVANIFIGGYINEVYTPAEYSTDTTGRNWFKDLFLGRAHDCNFYQSIKVFPPNFNFN